MKKEQKIKLFVTYKERHKLIKSDFIIPIQTGRAIADEIFDEMIGDDTGENISSKNNNYCCNSAQYWAWKNYMKIGNPDYIGFMHYRRHFIFNDKIYKKDIGGCVPFNSLDDSYFSEINMSKKDILNYIKGYDCITTKIDLNEISKQRKDPRWSTARGSWAAIIDLDSNSHEVMLEIVKELYPSYDSIIEKYLSSNIMHWYVSYIMTKELFFEYCQFLFSILKIAETRIDTKYYSKNAQRIFGYMAERLHTLFIMKKIEEGKKIKYANITLVQDTREEKEKQVLPLFQEKNVIVLAASKSFLPYTIVTIQSIIEHASQFKKYDIVVLNETSAMYYDYIIKKLSTNNISVRTFNPYAYTKEINIEGIKIWERLSPVTFWRLLSPEIFSAYNKVLFVDSDMIILDDVNTLFETNINGKPIAAVKDYEVQRTLNNERMNSNSKVSNYLKSFGIDNIDDYFNGGLLLFDVKKCLEFGYPEKYKSKIKQIDELLLADQDILNTIFNKNHYQLSANWNVCWQIPKNSNGFYKRQLPVSLFNEYENSRHNPKIIHYCGRFKPWINPDMELADYWWEYARSSPIYEHILYLHLRQKIPAAPQIDYQMLADIIKKQLLDNSKWVHESIKKENISICPRIHKKSIMVRGWKYLRTNGFKKTIKVILKKIKHHMKEN